MIDDQTPFDIESDEVTALEDVAKDKSESTEVHSVAAFVLERFNRAETKKQVDEQRFLRAYMNYRGIYGKDVQFTDSEKSRVFIKVTKTKVLGAYAQLLSVLFGSHRFPLSVEPSRLPEGVVEAVHMSPEEGYGEAVGSLFGTKGGAPLPPGATEITLNQRLGALRNKLEPVKDKLVEGEGSSPEKVTFHPAQVAAKKMEKKIHDQLDESNASKHLRSSTFEQTLFGTGIMKGPFAIEKEYPRWSDDGEYDPVVKTIPMVQHVSIWNFYPDPDAANMDEAEYVIERHKMSKQQLKALNRRPHFRKNAIDTACEYGPDYIRKYWESEMEDDSSHSGVERYEVLEFWGYMDAEDLEDSGIEVPAGYEDNDQLNVNIWVCNGQVLRAVVNPFKPSRIPYYAVPYEANPYSFFGVGIAENMDDTQTLMNGFMRMSVDNAVLSGNLVFEVDENNLAPGQDLKIYPGKVFRRQGGAPGQALFGTKFPNVTVETMALFDKARLLADESTGFPSYAHGQTNVQSVGRTASGISMLMDAAQAGIRTVVKNIDDYLLGPLGKAIFAFNMQFDFDPEIKGDLEVLARGTESLMANEVRSQRLMQFLGVVSNPVLAPFAKMDVIVREIAKSLDLDPDKVVNNMSEAALQAEIMKKFQGEQGMPSGAPQGGPTQAGQMPGMPTPQQAGTDAMDPSGVGGGTIGTGMAPRPGMEGFSAPNQGVM